jgi:hypothetical protein
MEIEVHQRGGVLGMDRRYLVRDGTLEVVDNGESHGARNLAPEAAAKIEQLAASAASARIAPSDELVSDDMETSIRIHGDGAGSNLTLHSGSDAPSEVWDLIGEVSRASGV